MEVEQAIRRSSQQQLPSSSDEEEEDSMTMMMMMKHTCKFCNKSFPSGRSLGGHMRSHLINNNNHDKEKVNTTATTTTDNKHKQKQKKNSNSKKPNSTTTTTTTTTTTGISDEDDRSPIAYELRENPKKTWRVAAGGEEIDYSYQEAGNHLHLIPPLIQSQTQSTTTMTNNNNMNVNINRCKECGKAFQSSKALSGHMKSHAVEREKERLLKEKQRSQAADASNNINTTNTSQIKPQQQQHSRQSDNERTLLAPSTNTITNNHHTINNSNNSRPRRSSRRPRYMGATTNLTTATVAATTTNSFSLSSANNNINNCNIINNNNQNHASSSVSGVDQLEQEEVAMSLIMLSRDAGPWGGEGGGGDISDNNSVFSEAPPSSSHAGVSNVNGDLKKNNKKKNKQKAEEEEELGSQDQFQLLRGRGEVAKLKNSSSGQWENGSELKRIDQSCSRDGWSASRYDRAETAAKYNFLMSSKVLPLQQAANEFGNTASTTTSSCRAEKQLEASSSVKRKLKMEEPQTDYENTSQLQKRSRFECATCNKSFHSYQALGGHRASHKKFKDCSAAPSSSKLLEVAAAAAAAGCDNNSEDTIEAASSSIHHNKSLEINERSKMMIMSGNHGIIVQGQKHECPICFKVFPSGQALGGHKRSHLLAQEAKNNNKSINNNSSSILDGSVEKQRSSDEYTQTKQEVRDLLDLNLPAPVEEDQGSNVNVVVGFKPWWVKSSHKQEQLVTYI